MKTGELKEYLGIVVDMEQSVYLQKTLLTNIQQQIKDLKNPKVFADPDQPVEPKLDMTTHTSIFEIIFGAVKLVGSVFIVLIIPVGIILDIFFDIKGTLEGWIQVLKISLGIAIALSLL